MHIFYDRMAIVLWKNIGVMRILSNGSQITLNAILTGSRKFQKNRKAIILLLLMRLQLDKLPLSQVQLSTFSWS
jgi:hypothetical protein